MSHRTTWTENLLALLRAEPEKGMTVEEAIAQFGLCPGRKTAEEVLENLAKNGRVRRNRSGPKVRYVIAPDALEEKQRPTFVGWARGGPKVASVFDLARLAR